MDLQQLRYAAAIARERHFGRAAAACFVTQPTLSQQIRKLERELGTPLFERNPRRVALTRAGETFVPKAAGLLEALDQAVNEVRDGEGAIAGSVRLGAIPTIGPYLLPDIIARTRREAPQLTLELHESTTSVLLENLRQGRVDFALLSLPVDQAGLLSRSFGREPFCLAVSRSHPLASRNRARVADLRRERLLILQEGHCFRMQALDYCALSDSDARIVFQGSSLGSVMRLAAAGEGVTFVPRMAARDDSNPGLRFVRLADPEPSREIGVVWRAAMPLTGAHRFVLSAIEGAVLRAVGVASSRRKL